MKEIKTFSNENIGLTNGGVKSTETRVTEFLTGKLK